MPRFKYPEDEAPRTETVSRAEGVAAASSHYREKGKGNRRTLKIVLISVLAVLVVLGIVGGVFATRLMDSAKEVKAEAQEVLSSLNGLTDAVKSADAGRMQEISQTVSVGAHNIQDDVHADLWGFAAGLPFVGQDIKSAQTLSDVLVDLADNALAPIAANSEIMNLSNIFHDGSVNIGALQGVIGALGDAAPVISRSADTIEALPTARIEQVSEMLEKARERIVSADDLVAQAQEILPYLPAMLGADGQTRRYLIVAQNNAEFRSLGGLPGSWGVMSITDGVMSLGDFESFLHIEGLKVDGTDEEHAYFATNFDTDPAQVNVLTSFVRVGQLCRQYWLQLVGDEVDGVVAIDPVFLQHMLAMTGGYQADDGTYIDGGNAAFELMNNVYWRYGENYEMQDGFFTNAAELAAKTFFEHIGDAGFLNVFNALKADIEARRFLVWMVREEEEAIIRKLGADGDISTDPTKPILGIYLNDDTYSKMSWYARVEINVGARQANEDGSGTYDVTVALSNIMTENEAYAAPPYITGTTLEKRNVGDMIDYLLVHAPAGATITDMQSGDAEFISEGWVYGLQSFRARVFTNYGNTSNFSLRVTVPPEAATPLEVRATPPAQEGNLIINYAEPPVAEGEEA